MKKRLLAIIAILATLPVVAEELPEILKPSYYGKCMVVPSEAGEDLAFVLNCKGKAGEGVLVGPPTVTLGCKSGKSEGRIVIFIRLKPGKVLRSSSQTIQACYQFDRAEVYCDTWYAVQNSAITDEENSAKMFLFGIAAAKRLHFQIGDSEPATIEFDEQKADAMRDFTARCDSL